MPHAKGIPSKALGHVAHLHSLWPPMNRLRQTLPALRRAASGRAGRVRNMSGHGSAEENAAEMERWKNITYVAVPAVFLLTAYTLSTASHHHDDEKIVRACVRPEGAAAAWNVVGWSACFTLGGLTFFTLLRPLFVCAGLRLHAHSKQAVAVGRCEHAAPACLSCVKALLTCALCTPASARTRRRVYDRRISITFVCE